MQILGRRLWVAIEMASLLRRRAIVLSVRVSINVSDGGTLYPTEGSSLAEVGTDGVAFYILHDIRILGILRCLPASFPSALSSLS
jgi:hypothetical protein